MGMPPYRTTSSSIDPWGFIRRRRTDDRIPHDFKAARIWLRDYLDRQYGVGGVPPKGERVRLAGVVVRKYFTIYFPNPAPKTGKPRLPDAKNVWFAVVKPIIAKRENKALSCSDQPTFIQGQAGGVGPIGSKMESRAIADH